MAKREKVTVSLDPRRLRDLDEISRKRRMSRSRTVEEAIDLLQRSELEQQLREGYMAMAEEDRRRAEEAIRAQGEILD